ncbi:MAG: methyltransferase domain-containing protein [Patescibacteria group bacterium]
MGLIERFFSEQMEQKEQETPIKRVFIELGAGHRPLPTEGDKTFSENDIYVGVDMDEERLKKGRSETQKGEKSSEKQNMYFVRGDATKLPLGSGISDEIFLRNILGDPGITQEIKDGFLNEAGRIAKDNGRLIIEETYTPRRLKEVRDILRQHGFIVERVEKISEKHSPFPDWDESFTYRVFAQKRPAKTKALFS